MKQGEGGSPWMMDVSSEVWSLCLKQSTLSTYDTQPAHNLMCYHSVYNAATLPYMCLRAYFKSPSGFIMEI